MLALLGLTAGLVACGGSGPNFVFSGFDTLTSGDNFANNRYYDVWSFEALRSGTAHFGMNSPDFFPHIEVEDDFGNLIAEFDHEGSQADVEISAHLQNGEIYHVIATSAFAGELGDYELVWEANADLLGVNRPGSAQKVKLKTQPKAGSTGSRSKPSSFDPTRNSAKASAGQESAPRG